MEPKLVQVLRSRVVPASLKHAKILAHTMRKPDREEIYAARAQSPKKVLMEAIRASHVAYAFYVQDELAALFGVVLITPELGEKYGVPWVLTGTAVEKDPREFWRWSKEGLRIFLEEYGLLVNMVDARHEQALRWLRHLGAEIDAEPKPHGKLGLPFYRFVFKRRS